MDDLIVGIFAVFVLSLFFIGFFRKQVLFTIFSGLGFIALGAIFLNGFKYVSGSNVTTLTNTLTRIDYIYSTWNSSLKFYLFAFLATFGMFLVIIGILQFIGSKKIDKDFGDGEIEVEREN